MQYQLIIFDFDGTLADSFPWLNSILNQLAEQYHFEPIEQSEVETLRGYSVRQMIARTRMPPWKIPLLAYDVRRRMAQNIEQVQLFEGVNEMLAQLAGQGLTLAVVSSNARQNILRVLGPENAACFKHFECGVGLGGKPARYRKLLRQNRLAPGQALCIGDELRDLEAAQQAQIDFGAVAWGYASPAALQACGPALSFASVAEIAERLST
jgi:phosphoglycolate phosphatase